MQKDELLYPLKKLALERGYKTTTIPGIRHVAWLVQMDLSFLIKKMRPDVSAPCSRHALCSMEINVYSTYRCLCRAWLVLVA